jgi:hypothetical protein
MAIGVTHSTVVAVADDGTSPVGSDEWNAGHTLSGFGTGVADALAINVGSAGAPVLFNGALGTPSSGTATNLTGTAAGLTAGTASAVAVGGITGLGTGVGTFLATPSSANLISAVTDETGTGALVFANTPTLVTPVLGVASATTINKVALTAPAAGSTITIADGKTLTASNSITLAGTDSTTITFPSSSATMLALNLEDQTITGGARVTSKSQTAGNITIDCGDRPIQHQTNSGAFTLTAPANDGYCMLLVTNDGSAGAITFSGFTVGSSLGDALTTTNTHKFTISIWRINGVSGYRIAAHQ